MPEKSATTYITGSIASDGDVLKAAAATQTEAETRLGGADGLRVESVHRLDDATVAVTWHRSWSETAE